MIIECSVPVTLVPISPAALFRAGKAFVQYRKAGGPRTTARRQRRGGHARVRRGARCDGDEETPRLRRLRVRRGREDEPERGQAQ